MSKTQRIEEKVTIHYEKGIHVRVAADHCTKGRSSAK